MTAQSKRSRITRISLTALTALGVATGTVTAVPGLVAPAVAQTNASTIEGTTPDGAKVTVQKNVTSGQTITLTGSGWTDSNGKGSSIAVKIRYATTAGKEGTYERTTDIFRHPKNGVEDKTIWAYFRANDNGSFSQKITLPKGLEAGQKLELNVASSLGREDDVSRTLTLPSLVVDNVAWAGDSGDKIKCKTDLSYPTLKVAEKPNADNTLTITGAGFCNSISGGAKVAFKIDDGKIQRTDNSVDANKTIWDMVKANDYNGTFSFNMPLPSGRTSGENASTPAFTSGVHTIRALSGSLQTGDPTTTFPMPTRPNDNRFVVGEYRPTTDPVAVSPESLTKDNKNVTVDKTTSDWKITVPNGTPGQWVYPSLYLEDGSKQAVWSGRYFQLDSNKQFTLKTAGLDLFEKEGGKRKLLVQNMDFKDTGSILGWGDVDPSKTVDPAPNPTPSTSSGSSQSAGVFGILVALLGLGGVIAAIVGYLQSTGQLRF